MARLKLRVLEEYLQTIEGFERPKIHLEQYVTRPHIASHLLHTAQTSFDDLEGKIIADLGCGCGTLTLGAAALGASFTLGFEVDTDAVKIFRKNAMRFGLPGQWGIKTGRQKSTGNRKKNSSPDQEGSDSSISDDDYDDASKDSGEESSDSSSSNGGYIPDSSVDVVLCDVTYGDGLGSSSCRWHKLFDTVVMNPPFGTKNNQGIDMAFLKAALGMANTAVYTLHKTSTRSYVIAKGKEWGGRGTTAEVLAKLRFDLPKSYRFHNKKSVDIEVDFIRFGLNDAISCAHDLARAMTIR
ncbi:rRNA N6-adenosine-methyltransferase METTL5 [Ischnura elegans]|uniref:rRNA N6-adenosine-methyltransferase METTL5 n=1 Tax=Ischnura elegans TaxID=197161 RepID=UPI001ED8A710|nr:rRNA N6-adenosine-methyltransferase METTL5 [Ischnura elegans]